MLTLSDQGKAIDVVTVTEELSAKKELEDVGGLSYLTELANAVPTAANIAHYAKIVEEKALLKPFNSCCNENCRGWLYTRR